MFAGLLSLLRFAVQFAYPLHDALTSYQRQDEKGFAVLVKYFFMTTLLLLAETVLRPLLNSGFFQFLLLAAAVALVVNDYALAASSFDFLQQRYARIGGSKLEGLINAAADHLNSVLKWFTRHIYKPSKAFVRRQIHRFFTKRVLGAEEEPDSDTEPQPHSEAVHAAHHNKKHG